MSSNKSKLAAKEDQLAKDDQPVTDQQLKYMEKRIKELAEDKKELQENVRRFQQDRKDQANQMKFLLLLFLIAIGFFFQMEQQLQTKNEQINKLIELQHQKYQGRMVQSSQQGHDGQMDSSIKQKEKERLQQLLSRCQYELDQELKKKGHQSNGLKKCTNGSDNGIDCNHNDYQSNQYNNVADDVADDVVSDMRQHQLKQSKNIIIIQDDKKLDEYFRMIMQYNQQGKQYQIILNFGYHSDSFASIDSKMEVIEMIDAAKAYNKVGVVGVGLSIKNKWNEELITTIISRYKKIYRIDIEDKNDYVDHKTHQMIKKWVSYQPISDFQFYLWPRSRMYANDDGLGLVKDYNKLIRQKQGLGWLAYHHKSIQGAKEASSEDEIQELIDKVSQI